MWLGCKCSRLEIKNRPHISLKTKGKIRLVTIFFFFFKANVDDKSGRSSVQRGTPIETLRSLEEVSMIV